LAAIVCRTGCALLPHGDRILNEILPERSMQFLGRFRILTKILAIF
jgi:hypothetical protein